MAKARPIRGLGPDTRFGDAAAAAVEVRAREVFEHADGVLDTGDIERVHDMRVATRRLRAALEVFAACFPKKEHKAVAQGGQGPGRRAWASAATPTWRSRRWRAWRASSTPPSGPASRAWWTSCGPSRRPANETVARALEEAEAAGLAERLEALALQASSAGRRAPA